jgi:FkbM family methyltransferase
LGNRSLRRVVAAPFARAHYRALYGMTRAYPDFVGNLRRYLTSWGEYPYRCRIRTPIGVVTPTLFTADDMRTVNEIFCRRDYKTGAGVGVVIDVGANIGLSALYFLTRNRTSRVYCFEPNPANVKRLHANLADFADRYSVEQAAIWTHDGEVPFVVEPTGRYGRVDVDADGLAVAARELNGVLEEVLRRDRRIDVLKIDTEGSEEALVRSIHADLLERIDTVFYESARPLPLHTDRFRYERQCDVNRLTLA